MLCSVYSCFHLHSDMEAKFRERDEREEQLVKAKEKLEKDIAEIMKMSGDNSSQLSRMNDELRLKERCVWLCQSVCMRPALWYSEFSSCWHPILKCWFEAWLPIQQPANGTGAGRGRWPSHLAYCEPCGVPGTWPRLGWATGWT